MFRRRMVPGMPKKKKGKKMKKIVLTILAMLSMTMSFAEETSANETEKVKAYDMTVDYKRLAVCLGLCLDQMSAVKEIHDTFCENMKEVALLPEDEQQEMLQKVLDIDMRYMSYVLERDQYRKYLALINVTLNNRGLLK
jgi:hypothetical protein